jgi:hypothetical protein
MWYSDVDSLGNLAIKLSFSLIGPHLNACRSTLSIKRSKLDDNGRQLAVTIPGQVAAEIGADLASPDRFNFKINDVGFISEDVGQPPSIDFIGVKHRRIFELHIAMLPE